MRVFVAVLLALMFFSMAACEERDAPKQMVYDCPDDQATQDIMISYAIECYSIQSKNWKRRHIRNEKEQSQKVQESCLEQATWFFCKRVEK